MITLIGDIHLDVKMKDRILDGLRKATDSPSENVVFLGDYLPGFVYDRKAMSELLELFIELATKGKNVYVMAGNHDWL
jgi:UDP-2,3-diacylglucosamine pyrophosphatase LpxH